MTENAIIEPVKPQQQTDAPASPQEAAFVGGDAIRSPLPDMKGRVNRHTSGYWALTIPALSVRYLAEAGANVIAKSRSELAAKFRTGWLEKLASIKDNKAAAHALDKKEATLVGLFMMGVSSIYLYRTYQDIKGAFAESIAWETGKKPENVGLRDILKSDNTLVEAARRNLFKYNARRFAVNSPFFANRMFKDHVEAKDAILFGVAANSLYLMSDVLGRKETFFERLQAFVDQKVIHTEQIGDKINAVDLINLYELHARDKNPGYRFTARMDTQEWQDRMKIFGRMADLLNETYGNQPNREKANFTLSKMIYLMGHGMVDSLHSERSCALIEVANRNGIEAVKDVVKRNAADGSDVAYAKEHYLSKNGVKPEEKKAENPQTGFAAKLGAVETAKSKTDKILAQRAANAETAQVQV